MRLGATTFRLAMSTELAYSSAVLDQAEKILSRQYGVFGGYVPKQALVVVNPIPGYARSLEYGGQAKPGNVMFYTRPVKMGVAAETTALLGNLAHETFHLWVGQSFRLSEGVYWFTEGFAMYEQYRLLCAMGLISREEMDRFLAREYITAAQVQKRTPVPLQRAGATLFGNPDYRTLDYSKGALVAYLLDEELRTTDFSGKAFDQFLRGLYVKYGVRQLPLGNPELANAIGEATGSDLFAQRWVLEPTAVTADDVPALNSYLKAAWLAALPEITLDFLNPPIGLKALICFLAVVLGVGYSLRPRRQE